MRLTFAVAFATHLMPVFNDLRSPNLLTAFPFPKTMELVTYSPEYLIMDSGAFSAWTVGEEIDIDAYIEWVKMNQKKFPRTIAINLDVIPGERGRMATKEERNAGMRESIKNADYIRNAGVANVMEVFHQFEPREFLDELLDRLPPGGILGLSPRNDAPVAVKMGWVDSVLAHLVKRFGKENLPRIHGLGVTSPQMLQQFPYYSADSSSWASGSRFGTYINEWGKTKPSTDPGVKITKSESEAFVMSMVRKSVENQMALGESITRLWEKRGITWED